jgi:hypothetical protein
VSASGGHRPSRPAPAAAPGPETIPLEQGQVLSDAATTTPGSTVAGISCEASEQVAYHVHDHVAVYVNGSSRPIPAGIGVVNPILQHTPAGDFAQASRCYYWLHTHAQDGVVHIESPSLTTYTLGQFFAEWRQPLSSRAVAGAAGPVTAYVNGKRFTGDPADIPLTPHAVIQLDVGTDVAPQPVDWAGSGL